MADTKSDDACCSTSISVDNLNILEDSAGEFQIGNWSVDLAANDEVSSNLAVEVFNRDGNIPTESISFMDDAVFLEFPKFSKGFQESDFREFVRKYIGEDNLIRLENWNQPNLWILQVKTKEIRENLLRMWKTKIKNKTCWIKPYYEYEFRGFLHWLPHFITNEEVKTQLSIFGEVVILENVVHDHWKGKVQSEARYFGLRLKDEMVKNDMPHFLKFGGYRALVLVRGRQPACFHCREFGHSKKDCKIYKEKKDAYCKNPEAGKPRIKPRGRRHRPQPEEESDNRNKEQQYETKSTSTSVIHSPKGLGCIAESDSLDNKQQDEIKSVSTNISSSPKGPECISEAGSQDKKQQDKPKSTSTNIIPSQGVESNKLDLAEISFGRESTVVIQRTEILSILQSLKEWEKKTVEMVEQTLESMKIELRMKSALAESNENFSGCSVETMVEVSFREMKRSAIKLISETSIYLKKIAAERFGEIIRAT